MISFDEDENLGKVVSSKKLESFGEKPLTNVKDLVYVAGGSKMSNLCKFKFTSKAPTMYKDFCIAFVCKLRSKIYHQKNTNPSQWFIFKIISEKEVHCLSKSNLLDQYGFDIDKFFQSDYFAEGVQFFKKCIQIGCDEYVPQFLKKHGNEEVEDAQISFNRNRATLNQVVPVYVTAIKDSLNYIDKTTVNDKFYKLISYDDAVFEVEKKDKLEEEIDNAIEEAMKKIYC